MVATARPATFPDDGLDDWHEVGHDVGHDDGHDAGPDDWPRRRRGTAVFTGLWLVVTLGTAWFARDLQLQLAGWPLNFWLAAQGAPLAFGLLVWGHELWAMRLGAAAARRPEAPLPQAGE
jgi:putative solute:sodium symporter small subunit